MNHKVESDFEYNGYRCIVLAQSTGHRCGYVGIEVSHPLYGKDYGDKCAVLSFDKVKDLPVGKRGVMSLLKMSLEELDEDNLTSPDCYFDVHGGITYASGGDESKYPVESNLWWLGFDCAHAGDGKDFSIMDERHKEIYEGYPNFDGDTVKDTQYCINECKSLADQLYEIETIYKEKNA